MKCALKHTGISLSLPLSLSVLLFVPHPTVINAQVNGVDDTIKILLVIQCGGLENAISHVGVMETFL